MPEVERELRGSGSLRAFIGGGSVDDLAATAEAACPGGADIYAQRAGWRRRVEVLQHQPPGLRERSVQRGVRRRFVGRRARLPDALSPSLSLLLYPVSWSVPCLAKARPRRLSGPPEAVLGETYPL